MDPNKMNITNTPQVRIPLRCRFRFHRKVELPKPENKIMRRFIIRKIEGCTSCGALFVTRFDNILGGGGHFRTGYVHPDELKPKDTPLATSSPAE